MGLNLLVEFTFLIEELFFHLKEFLFFYDIGLLIGGLNHPVVFSLYHITENIITRHTANNEGYDSGN